MNRCFAVVLAVGMAITACGGDSEPSATGVEVARTIAINAGNSQSVTAGVVVPVPPSVLVTENGAPKAGVAVSFAVTAGGGTLTGPSALSDENGIASVGGWRLGAQPGTNRVTATAVGHTGSPVTFWAMGLAPSLSGSWTGITGGQAVTLTLLETSGAVSGTGTLSNTPSGLRALTVSGTFANAVLSASITSGTVQPFNLTATFSGTVLTGTLAGSGFTGDVIVLNRNGSTTSSSASWAGTYDIISVDGNPIPALNFVSQLGYSTSVTSRDMVLNADGTGTWNDATTSSLYCFPAVKIGPQCDASGSAVVAWAVNGTELTVVRSTHNGYVQSSKRFQRQPDGTLLKTDNSATEIYRKR